MAREAFSAMHSDCKEALWVKIREADYLMHTEIAGIKEKDTIIHRADEQWSSIS